jgi:hypothetical protein
MWIGSQQFVAGWDKYFPRCIKILERRIRETGNLPKPSPSKLHNKSIPQQINRGRAPMYGKGLRVIHYFGIQPFTKGRVWRTRRRCY